MRLFVALDLTPEVRQRLEGLIHELCSLCPLARWVRPAGLHLTLKFLGEVGEERLPRILQSLEPLSQPLPIQIELRGLGYFPSAGKPRVLWVGIQASPNLSQLVAEIETALEPQGFAREERPFRPHLTLARFPDPGGLAVLRKRVAELEEAAFGQLEAREFQLYRSQLSPRGADYTVLHSFPLRGPAPPGKAQPSAPSPAEPGRSPTPSGRG